MSSDTDLLSIAACDPEAFYPLRSLVEGPFTDLSDLPAIERFVRTVVLHDEIFMNAQPFSYDAKADADWSEEEQAIGSRSVIVAIAPYIPEFQFFTDMRSLPPVPEIELSESLLQVAADSANAGPGNVYYNAHLDFLKRMLGVVETGGSALICGSFGREAIDTAVRYPAELFRDLDKEWRDLAKEFREDGVALSVPPVLGIVLTRAAKREAIPTIIRDLREEWAIPRKKVWTTLRELRRAQTVAQVREIRAELEAATQHFAISSANEGTHPFRILWEVLAAGVGGATTSFVSGGNPIIGGSTNVIGQVARSFVPWVRENGPAIFRRGAFDLAERVRNAANNVEMGALPRLLNPTEKRSIGLGM